MNAFSDQIQVRQSRYLEYLLLDSNRNHITLTSSSKITWSSERFFNKLLTTRQ